MRQLPVPRFYPRHPRGWRQNALDTVPQALYVSIHATLAGGDLFHVCTSLVVNESFYPRHPRGWRRLSMPRKQTPPKFLSTPPSRVATKQAVAYGRTVVGFYPRHPRGWRHSVTNNYYYITYVSIHATLAGGDTDISEEEMISELFLSTPPSRVATGCRYCYAARHYVSIHATLAGGDRIPRERR